MDVRQLGTFPKKKKSGRCNASGLILGMNASEEVLNTTPVGIYSPKRRLVWTPETPRGKSKKYSIGETVSPCLKERNNGIILINGRYAIPCDERSVVSTTMGLGALNLCDNVEENSMKKGKEKRSSPTMKTGARTPRGRGRRNKSIKIDPKQKLLPQMIQRRAGDVKDSIPGSETQE